MKLFRRAASCLLAALFIASSVPTAVFAEGDGQGSLPAVPEGQELVYFVDSGASSFPEEVQNLIGQYPDSVKNPETPDQQYEDGGQTWGYTNANEDVMTYDGSDAYETLRCFQSGHNGMPMQYRFAAEPGTYSVFVGLYDPWTASNRVREASVAVTGAEAQTYVYRDHGKEYLTFGNVNLTEGPLEVIVSPLGDTQDDDHDVLVSFIMITRQKTEEPEPEPEPDPTPEQPAMPNGETRIWGKDGQGWKLDITYQCTNPAAAHKGGETKHNNFISGKFFTFGDTMTYDTESQTWRVEATVNAEAMMEDVFGEAHPGATCDPAQVTLAYQEESQKWYIVTDEDKAVLTLTGACAPSGPAAPVLGENLEVWVQLYDGEYGAQSGYQIDRQPSKYKNSLSFTEPVQGEDGQWTCEMTVTGWTEDETLAASCYGNLNMPAGYEIDPYELIGKDDAARTVTLTYNQNTGKWQCPEISLKKTTKGTGVTNPQTHYGVAFKVMNTENPDQNPPSLPVENPVHNGGFWVTLYEDTPSGAQEVFTQVYDGTQDYLTFSDPACGEGLLKTYETTATVDPAKVLAASGLTGYVLVSDEVKTNALVFDWDTMTWTAQTMHPQFRQPGSTVGKRGVAFEVKSSVPTPEQPAMPNEKTSIWGKDGQGWKLSVTYQCTNPAATHKVGKTENKNFISGKYFVFGDEMTYDTESQTWRVEATVNAEAMMEDFFGVAHPGATCDPAQVTLAYQEASNKWYIVTDADKAVLTLTGACAPSGPAAPVLGENLEVWVQLYDGEYGAQSGYQIDRQPSKYKNSLSFTEPVQGEDGQWTCEMTVTGWTEDETLAASCYGNLNMPAGYEIDPYELIGKDDAARTVTLTYNQNTGKWQCPEISLKKTTKGTGVTNPQTHYGVAFKVMNTANPDQNPPSLPVENPVHNGGFWVTLYEKTSKGNQEVFTQVYDGTQDYLAFSDPAYGEGILETYQTIATVDPAKVLAASGLTDYVLVSDTAKANALVFDWDTLTWTAQTMQPQFQQPGSTVAKRGVAFEVKKIPQGPTKDNCSFMVTVYTEQPKDDGTVVNTSQRSFQWYLAGDKAEVTFSEPAQDKDGNWTCTATINAKPFVDEVLESYASSHIRRDDTDPTTKTITLTYDEARGKWNAPEDGVTYGYPSKPETKKGVAFRTIQQYTVTYKPGRDLKYQIPAGDPVDGGAFDKGATVELPETTTFQTENGIFAGWKVTIKKAYNNSDVYFYPIGTDMTMFGQNVEVEAYWMDVELEVASIPYDEVLTAKDYTFGKAAEFSLDGDSVTLLYRATVKGNSQYPYALSLQGAQAVYDTALEGTIDKYQTSKTIYFTKTYTPGELAELEESLTLGAASDTVALRFHQDAYTLTPSHTSIYTGGEAYSENHGLPETYDLDGLGMITSITVGEETTQYTEEEQEEALEYLKSLMMVDYLDADRKPLQDDKLDGAYVAALHWIAEDQEVLVNGSEVNLEDGVLIVRPVTDPSQADDQQNELLFVLQNDEPAQPLTHAVAVAKAGSDYYINNDTGRVLTDASHVSLLDDSLLTEGNDALRIQMEVRGDQAITWGNESPAVRNQYAFHYLDLVDPQQGNLWVAASKGVTVYLPYPEGTDQNTEFKLLHYKDLHREYGLEGQEKVEEAIDSCELEVVPFTKTDAGLRFEVGQGGFSPFAIVWQTANQAPVIQASDRTITAGDAFDALQGVTASDPEDGDLTKAVTVKNSNVNKDQAGSYTVTYQVADRQGAVAEATITVTVKAPEGTTNPDTTKPDTTEPDATEQSKDTSSEKSDNASSASKAAPTATPAPASAAAPSAAAAAIPQTGDSLPVGWLGGLGGMALLGLAVLMVLRRSKHRS